MWWGLFIITMGVIGSWTTGYYLADWAIKLLIKIGIYKE